MLKEKMLYFYVEPHILWNNFYYLIALFYQSQIWWYGIRLTRSFEEFKAYNFIKCKTSICHHVDIHNINFYLIIILPQIRNL